MYKGAGAWLCVTILCGVFAQTKSSVMLWAYGSACLVCVCVCVPLYLYRCYCMSASASIQ